MAAPVARSRLRGNAARRTVNARLEKPAVSRAGVASGSNSVPVIAVTSGEPAGIGPDVCLALAQKRFAARIVIATTHLALKDVPRALTREGLERTLRVLHAELIRRFGISAPRILVAGLNPHSGEGGYFGREEIEVIEPVLEKLRAEGLRLTGPLPADTLFVPDRLSAADCVLAMYHDQGLPVLKYASFGRGINVTLGLPMIRTSVDHGTAIELSGTGRAEPDSLIEAVEAAIEMAQAETRTAR